VLFYRKCGIVWNYWCRCNVLQQILCQYSLGVENGQKKEGEGGRAIDMLHTICLQRLPVWQIVTELRRMMFSSCYDFPYYYTLNSLSLFWLAESVQWIFEISACDVISAGYTVIVSRTLKVTGNHVKFVHFVLLAISEEGKTWLPFFSFNIRFGFCLYLSPVA